MSPFDVKMSKMLAPQTRGMRPPRSYPYFRPVARLLHDNVIDHIELLFLDHFKDRYLPDLWLVERLGLLKPGVSTIVADNIEIEAPQSHPAYVGCRMYLFLVSNSVRRHHEDFRVASRSKSSACWRSDNVFSSLWRSRC